METPTNGQAHDMNNVQQHAVTSRNARQGASKIDDALSLPEIREHVMLFLDARSLIKSMRVSHSFRNSAEKKILQTKLFFTPEVKSSVWIIDHDDHTVEHKIENVEPLQFVINQDLSTADDSITGIRDLSPLKLNDLLFPSVDTGIQDHHRLYRQVFHSNYGPLPSRFFLGVVPLGIRREESCYNMLLTQPPVVRVEPSWVFLCRGQPIYRTRRHELSAADMSDWTLIDLDGVPLKLGEDDRDEYHVFTIPSPVVNARGVRFRDLIVNLYQNLMRAHDTRRIVVALVCHIPPPLADEEHSHNQVALEATRVGIHSLFPTTVERENIESVEKCQGPWGSSDSPDEREVRERWVGQSLIKPEPKVEEWDWPLSAE